MQSNSPTFTFSERDTDGKSLKTSSIDLTSRIKYPEDRRFPVKFGGYADIYMAYLDGLKVAVKVMRDVGVNEEKKLALSKVGTITNSVLELLSAHRTPVEKKIQEEISIWSSLEHQNILPLKGFTFFPPEASEVSVFALVSPWMERGTLLDYNKACSNIDRCMMVC